MLKAKINKEAFDKLSDELKKLYTGKDDEYTLQVEGIDDAAALKDALKKQREEATTARKERDDALAEIEAAKETSNKKKGDVDALEKSYKEKSAKEVKAVQDKYDSLLKFTSDKMIEAEVATFTGEITDQSALMRPHVAQRYQVDTSGDLPVLKIVGKDGKPSALDREGLKKEFLQDKDFASIITKSRATGGGAAKNSQTTSLPGGAATDASGKPLMLDKMGSAGLVAHLDAKKQG